MKHVLFIHQSGEMYGSDKTLLFLIRQLDRSRFNPIVLIPFNGPLRKAFDDLGVECHILPLIKVNRATLSLRGFLTLPFHYRESMQAIDRILDGRRIDLVHSNTLAVLSGAFWAKRNNIPHLWHVHEMIIKPWVVKKGFGWLLQRYADSIVCNSHATKQMLVDDTPSLSGIAEVIWNGIETGIETPAIVALEDAQKFRESIGVKKREILFTLMGRINRWKGQQLFVDAAERLLAKGIDGCKFLIIGSPPPDQHYFLRALEEKIDASAIKDKVTILPFTSEIWAVWKGTDVAVVPSTEPEPFGLVVTEAMSMKVPVIASNHGGVAEIVVHGNTGLLFDPTQPEELADCMERMVREPEERKRFGNAGERRFQKHFTLTIHANCVEAMYKRILSH